MKKVYYEDGPDTITAGIAGHFKRGEPKALVDEVAALLLKKPLFKEFKEKSKKEKED